MHACASVRVYECVLRCAIALFGYIMGIVFGRRQAWPDTTQPMKAVHIVHTKHQQLKHSHIFAMLDLMRINCVAFTCAAIHLMNVNLHPLPSVIALLCLLLLMPFVAVVVAITSTITACLHCMHATEPDTLMNAVVARRYPSNVLFHICFLLLFGNPVLCHFFRTISKMLLQTRMKPRLEKYYLLFAKTVSRFANNYDYCCYCFSLFHRRETGRKCRAVRAVHTQTLANENNPFVCNSGSALKFYVCTTQRRRLNLKGDGQQPRRRRNIKLIKLLRILCIVLILDFLGSGCLPRFIGCFRWPRRPSHNRQSDDSVDEQQNDYHISLRTCVACLYKL